jgi:hypothetical protein
MSETVRVNIDVGDNGTTAKLNVEAAKLRSNYEGAQRAASNTKAFTSSAAARPASSALSQASEDSNLSRGVSGVTGAAGRDFAAQAQGLGGLVHVYATFAANLFAVTAAFEALSKAADVTNMVKGLDQLGAVSGQALGSMAKHITTLTDGAISLKDAMTATAQATSGGLSSEQINRLTTVAKNASQALGRDMPDALSRLTRGIVKIEPELLDELGIMAKVIPSQQAYAREVGKSVSALTDFEKRQAYAIAVITEGEKKFGAIQIDANPYSKLLASMTNLALAGAELANKVLGPIAKILAESPTALGAIMAGIAGMLLSKAIPALTQYKQVMLDSAIASGKLAKSQKDAAENFDIEGKLAAGEKAANKFRLASAAAAAEAQHILQTGGKNKLANIFNQDDFKVTESTLQSIDNEYNKVTERHMLAQAAYVKAVEEGDKKEAALAARRASNAAEQAKAISLARSKAVDSMIQSKEADNARERAADEVEKNFSRLSVGGALVKKAEDAEKAFSKMAVQANVAGNVKLGGLSYALKELKKDIEATTIELKNADGTTQSFSKVKLDPIEAGFARLKGVITAAGTAVAIVASSFQAVLVYIGIVVATFQILDSIFSSNEKQATNYSTAIDTLTESFDNIDRTLAAIENKKPLEQINAISIQASAMALKELSDSLINVTQSFKDLNKYSSGWDKAWDWIKGIFGKGSQDKLAEGMGKSVDKALLTISDPKRKEEATKSIQSLFGGEGVDISGTNIKKMMQSLSESDALAVAEKITEELKNISMESSNAASRQAEFTDAMKKGARAAADLSNSYIPTDKVSQVIIAQVESLGKLALASASSKGAVTALTEAVSSFSNLSAFPPEMATALLDHKNDIEKIGEQYATAKAEASLYTKTLTELIAKQKQLEERKSQLNSNGRSAAFIDMDSSLQAEENKLKAQIATMERAKSDANKNAQKAEEDMQEISSKFTPLISKSLLDAFNVVNKLVDQAGEKASINFSKAINDLIPGGGSVEEATRLAQEEISVQEKMLEIDRAMIIAMDTLGAKYALATAESDIKKYEGNKNSPEYKAALASRDAALGTKNLVGMSSAELKAFIDAKKDEKDQDQASLAIQKEAFQLYQKQVNLEVKSVELAGQHNVISLQGAINLLKQQESNIAADMEASKNRQVADLNSLDMLTSYSSLYNEVLEKEKLSLRLQINRTEETKAQLAYDSARQQLITLENAGASSSSIQQGRIRLSVLEQQLNTAKQIRILEDTKANQENDRARLASLKFIRDEDAKIADFQLSIENSNIDLDRKRLDSANSLYTLNQEMYNAELRALDIKAEKLRYNNELMKLENRKADVIDPKQQQLDRLDASIKAGTEEVGSQSPEFMAQQISEASILRTEISKLTDTYNADAEALSISNKNKLTSIGIDYKAKEEVRALNDLLAAQTGIVEGLSAVFGTLGTSIGNVVDAFFKMSNAQDKLDKGKAHDDEELRKKAAANEFKTKEEEIKAFEKVETKYRTDSIKNELTGYAKIAEGVKGLFSEKTAAYKVFNAFEVGLHVAKLGMDIAEITSAWAKASQENAATLSTIPVNAQGALTKALNNVFPYNLIAFAVVAAMLASIGSMSGGGGAAPAIPQEATAQYRQEQQGTGTVLGDSTAHSNSIAKGIDILSAHSFEMLDYTHGMLTALKSIDKGMSGLANALVKVGGITGVNGKSAFGTVESSSSSPGFLGIGASSSSTSITDTGIQLQGTVKQLSEMNGIIKQYETTVTQWTKSGFLGIGSSSGTSVNTQFKDIIDNGTKKQVSMIFSGMRESIVEGMKLLSFSSKDIADLLSRVDAINFVGDALSVSLKGLSGDDIKNALNGVFSAAFDKMVGTVAPWAVKFQKVGEGLGETFIRLASDARTLNMSLEAAGMGVNSFNIQFEKGHPKDTVKYASQAQLTELDSASTEHAALEAKVKKLKEGGLFSLRGIVDVTDDSVLTEYNSVLAKAQDDLAKSDARLAAAQKAVGDATTSWAEDLTKAQQYLLNGAGGADAFNSKLQFITDNFMTSEQKLAPVSARVRNAFADMTPKTSEIGSVAGLGAQLQSMGLAVPNTRAEFTNLLTTLSDPNNALGITTEKGADLFNALLDIAPAFDAVATALEGIAKTVADIVTRGQDMIFNMKMDVANPEQKYSLVDQKANDYNKIMHDSTKTFSEQAIAANRLLDTINQGWGLLNDDQKKEGLAQYTAKVTEIMAFMEKQGMSAMVDMTPDGIGIIGAVNSSRDAIVSAIKSIDPSYNPKNDPTLAHATADVIAQHSIDKIASSTLDLAKIAKNTSVTPEAEKLPEIVKSVSEQDLAGIDSIATKMGEKLSTSVSSAIATNPQISAALKNSTDVGARADGMTSEKLPAEVAGILDHINTYSSATIADINSMVSMFSGLEKDIAKVPSSPEVEAFKQDLASNKQALKDQESTIEASKAAATAAVANLAAGTGSLANVTAALQGLISSLAAVAKEPANVNVSVSVSAPAGSEVGTGVH